MFGKTAGVESHMTHGIQRIADDDNDGVRRSFGHLFGHFLHDAGVGAEQVVTAHSGLAGDSGGNNDDIRSLCGVIGINPGQMRIVFLNWRRFGQI